MSGEFIKLEKILKQQHKWGKMCPPLLHISTPPLLWSLKKKKSCDESDSTVSLRSAGIKSVLQQAGQSRAVLVEWGLTPRAEQHWGALWREQLQSCNKTTFNHLRQHGKIILNHDRNLKLTWEPLMFSYTFHFRTYTFALKFLLLVCILQAKM